MSGDFDFDHARGLPEKLPEGERLLWQGAPDWRLLAVEAFHIRKVAVYFALLLLWSLAVSYADGKSAMQTLAAALWPVGLGAAACAILAALAWLHGRMTVYSITSKRLVLQSGIAVPMTINIPFTKVAAAGFKAGARGHGDLPLELAGKQYIAFYALWPSARPWRFLKPEPMLRAVPEGAQVARLLAEALSGAPATLVQGRAAAAAAPARAAMAAGGAS